MSRGLLDTSVLVATESGRPLNFSLLPDESSISPITIGELRAGVLAATTLETKALRTSTLLAADGFELLPIDEAVANAWALLRTHLAEAGRRLNVNDLWIAATAVANRIPVYTQDDDFQPLAGAPGLEVIRV
ncbi:MAG: type II toxin-antitoxin system VapC family toxin [Actinomycetota bacterium]|nr:type II toxin-antitoxin system VapC family toxin [Actinomycetota bacterium]